MESSDSYGLYSDFPSSEEEYFFRPRTPDSPINELTEKLRRLQIPDSNGIVVKFDPNYVYLEPQIESTSKKFPPEKPKKTKHELNVVRRRRYREKKKFSDFVKSLTKDEFSVDELTSEYNKFYEINQPISSISFAKIKEVSIYFIKDRIQVERVRKTVYKKRDFSCDDRRSSKKKPLRRGRRNAKVHEMPRFTKCQE